MPFGDGTGPMGMGPMTGRGAGYCAGFGVPGYMNRSFGPWGAGFRGGGRGFGGCGRGFGGGGRGWRNMYWATGIPGWIRFGGMGAAPMPYAPPGTGVPLQAPPMPYAASGAGVPQEAERQLLTQQVAALEAQLEQIRARLGELSTAE